MNKQLFSTAFLNEFEKAAEQIHEHYIEGHRMAKKTFLNFLHDEISYCDFETYSNIKEHREKAMMKDKGSLNARDISDFLTVAYYDIEFENKYVVSPILSFIDEKYLNGMLFSYPLTGFEVTIDINQEDDRELFWEKVCEAISEDEAFTKLHQILHDDEVKQSLISLGFVHFFDNFPFKQ